MHRVWEVLSMRCLIHCGTTTRCWAALYRSSLWWWIFIWTTMINPILLMVLIIYIGLLLLLLLLLYWGSGIHTVHKVTHVGWISTSYHSAVVHCVGCGLVGGVLDTGMVYTWLLRGSRGRHTSVAVRGVVLRHVLRVGTWDVVLLTRLGADATETAQTRAALFVCIGWIRIVTVRDAHWGSGYICIYYHRV